jgi:hypothetical protein
MESVATLVRSIGQLSNSDLLGRLQQAVRDERRATVEVVSLLMEVDARQLYLAEGCSSLFTYCTRILHLSEDAAYKRIEAARAARRFPELLERLATGSLTLTTARLLAPHLTSENVRDLLNAAEGRSRSEVEHLIATVRPLPDAAALVRRVATPGQAMPLDPSALQLQDPFPEAPAISVPTRPAHVTPLAPERYRIQVTVSGAAYEQLRQVRDLIRHAIPNGDLGLVFERAIAALHAELLKTKAAVVARPRPARDARSDTRYIPANVKREVWKRDDGQCAFVGTQGRCTETGFLEFHHRVPFADGGTTIADNLELRCRAHNAYEAERWFGPADVPLVREEPARWGAG